MGKDISCIIEMYFASIFEILIFLISLGMVIRLLSTICPNSFWSIFQGLFNDKNIHRTINLSLPVMSYLATQDEKYNSNSGRSLIVIVWTVLLEIIRTTLVLPWELWESIEQFIRIIFVMYLVFTKISLEVLRVDLLILCVCGLIFEFFKAVTLKNAKKSPRLGKNPELVAIYMEQIMKNDDNQDLPMITSLSSCKYIVFEEANGNSTFGPNYDLTGQTQSSPDNLITVGKLFQLSSEIDRELNTSYPCWREIGISFALAKMLRRRFSRLPLVEAGTREALEFVLNGLMGSCNNSEEDLISEEVDEDIAKRVFRIIRTELSFLTDILHIEVSAFYNSLGIVFRWSFFIAFICTCPCIIWAVITRRSIWLSPATVDRYKKCPNMFLFNLIFRDRNVMKRILNVLDILITVTLIFSCAFNLIMWLWRYYNSNWRTLHIIRDLLKDLNEHIKVHKRSFNIQKRDEIPSNCPETIEHTYLGLDFGFLGPLSWVHTDVQKALLTSLKNNKGKITSGQSSLERHNVFQDLKWACQPNQSNTEAILVWHIATVLFKCHNHPSQQCSDRKTALTLSNYCEYLIYSFPELLPDPVYRIESVYKKLKEDITRAPKHTDEISQSKEVNEEISRAQPSNKISESEVSLCRKILHGKWNENSVVEKGV